jgi:glutamate formiminotransferase/formiminotetrahydrofolate cyclodeaminase
LETYLWELASSEAVPGGGSASALSLAQASALISMVCGIGLKSKKYSENWEKFERIRTVAKDILKRAKELIYEDTQAFKGVMDAYRKKEGIREALIRAAEVPLETAELSLKVLNLCSEIKEIAPKSAISDVYTAKYQAIASFKGAIENVKINLESLEECPEKQEIKGKMEELLKEFKNYENN